METNWIRFDPDDKLTWPEMEDEYFSKSVIACSEDGLIYIGCLRESHGTFEWVLTNQAEDVDVPLDCVAAWMPLPEPFKGD